ncbi:MAG: carbohydrate-binding domain-containing protein [Prevotellaceae bacterium]|nr:carbohydrate-binding domain-containing protein [Prevotellaceae bacterium]
MKKLLFIAVSLFAPTISAQNIYIYKGTNYTTANVSDGLEIPLSENVDSVTFYEPKTSEPKNYDDAVEITYSGTEAAVVIPQSVEGVTCSSGTSSDVVLTSTNTTGEITYKISGASSNGSLTINGEYKMTVLLNGVTLTSLTGAAINIKCGKRIALVMADGSANSLADAANGSQKACIYTKGHLELSGAGTLNVTGNANHAIASKEYLQVKKSVKAINVQKAANDGIHVGQYFQMNGGEITMNGIGGDGIQVEYKTDDNGNAVADEENTGAVTISGGNLSIAVTATAAKGIKAEGNITFDESHSAPIVNVTTTGGVDTSDSNDIKGCVAMKSDGNITVDGGSLTLTSTGQGGRALTCDGMLTINGGSVNASAKGANYGTQSNDMGGGGMFGGGGPGGNRPSGPGNNGNGSQTQNGSKSAKGVKAEGAIVITGGDIKATSASHEGMESKSTFTMTGGTLYAEASDDALNSAKDMTISGGVVYAYSTGNDGIDSNGNIYMKGGVAIGFGAGGAESGIDTEESCRLYLTGGYIFGIGGRIDCNVSASSQAYGSVSSSFSSGYAVLSNGNERLFAVKLPKNNCSGTVLCSEPTMASGTSYSLGTATSVSGEETNGFIISPSVSSVSNTYSFTGKK